MEDFESITIQWVFGYFRRIATLMAWSLPVDSLQYSMITQQGWLRKNSLHRIPQKHPDIQAQEARR